MIPQVRELRLVRREGGSSSLCSVLVRFDDQASADDFYANTNGRPVSKRREEGEGGPRRRGRGLGQ